MHIHIQIQIHAQFQSLYKSSQTPYSFLHRVEIDMFLCDSDLSKETKEEKKAEEGAHQSLSSYFLASGWCRGAEKRTWVVLIEGF
jgi:hypothetical protein